MALSIEVSGNRERPLWGNRERPQNTLKHDAHFTQNENEVVFLHQNISEVIHCKKKCAHKDNSGKRGVLDFA